MFAFSLHRSLILRIRSLYLFFVRLDIGVLVAIPHVCVLHQLYTPYVGSSSLFTRMSSSKK